MKNKMKKQVKALVLSTVSIVCMILCALMVIFGLQAANKQLCKEQANQLDICLYAVEYGETSAYLTDEVRSYAVTGDEVHYENYITEVEKDKNREKYIGLMKKIGLSDEEVKLIEEVESMSNGLVPDEEKAIDYVKEGKRDKAYSILYSDEYSKTVEKISKTVDEFEKTINERMEKRVDEKNTEFRIMVNISLIQICIMFVVQVILIVFVLKELISPIKKIEKKMHDLSDGNINSEFDIAFDNTEIGRTAMAVKEFTDFQNEIIKDIDYLLSEMSEGNFRLKTRCEEKYKGDYNHILMAMRNLNRTLNGTLQEIDTASEQLNVGAEQIANVAQALSQGATEQAASVEELTATVENVAEQIKEIAVNAKEADEISIDTEKTVNECDFKMKRLNEAMRDIEEKSHQISSIIKTIDDIAFQTNILALNAAVEAARAGSAGKGFAVVADEVRNLASRSADAAAETTELIEQTVNSVNNGKGIAEDTTGILQEVVNKSTQTESVVQKISQATEKQSAAIEQVAIGMDQINTVVQTNSATAEETAAASEEFSGQAGMLKTIVGNFTLRD